VHLHASARDAPTLTFPGKRGREGEGARSA